MPKFTICADEDSLASRPKRWSRSLPLQSTSAHNELETSPAGVKKTRKGKGKAKDYSGGPRNSKRAATAWKDVAVFHRYLSTRHDSLLLPFRIPPSSMLDLFETVVQNRDTLFDEVDAEVDERIAG
ncbi:hypothetical protein JCM8547_005293 [Rhodosporidiobolus lusitaniae]